MEIGLRNNDGVFFLLLLRKKSYQIKLLQKYLQLQSKRMRGDCYVLVHPPPLTHSLSYSLTCSYAYSLYLLSFEFIF